MCFGKLTRMKIKGEGMIEFQKRTKNNSLIVLFLLLFFLSTSVGAQPKSDSTNNCKLLKADIGAISSVLDHWISWRIEVHKTPSISFGLVCKDELILAKSYGYSDVENKVKATPETAYRIASVTKTFTALGVMQLIDQRKLSLTEPITKYLPWVKFKNSKDYDPITIEHLLTHTAGVPTNSLATDFNAMTQPKISTVKEELAEQSIVFNPGSNYKYSNLGYALLGELISVLSGISYNSYIEKNILTPLGMISSLAHPTKGDDIATGYYEPRLDGSRRVADYQDLAYSTPAGGVSSNVYDMAHYISFQINPSLYSSVLSDSSVKEMQSLQWEVEENIAGSGYSWFVDKLNNGHQISHSGGLPAQTSQLQIDLSNGIGVIVMANAQDGEPTLYAREILNITKLSLNKEKNKSNSLKKYEGHFKFEEWEARTVILGNKLYMIYPVLVDPLSATFTLLKPTTQNHVFTMEGGPNSGEKATFIFDEGNRRVVKRLSIPSFYFDAVIE